MAELVIPPGFAIAKFRYQLTGDPEEMITTLGVELDPDDDDVDQANAIAVTWGIDFCIDGAGLSDEWTFLGVDLQMGNDPPPGVVVRSNVPALEGTGNFATMPQNCAVLIQKRSLQPGRRGRGRMFVPPGHFGEGDVNAAGVIAPAALTATQNRIDNVFDTLSAGPIATPPVIFHTEAPTDPTPVSQLTVAPIIATQRQRLRR